jgi:hypothetical protein
MVLRVIDVFNPLYPLNGVGMHVSTAGDVRRYEGKASGS